MKSIILTYCSGYSEEIYTRFAGSLFDTDYKGIIIFFIKENDISKLINIKKKYLDQIKYVIVSPTFHVQSYRYILYKEYLEQNKNVADYIFICDSRDVLFQKNFDNYDLDINYDLFVFRENIKIKNDHHNTKWIKALDNNENIYNKIKNNFAICSGTTYGTYNGMLDYLNIFCDILDRYPNNHMFKTIPSDQGIHNYIIYDNLINNIKIMDNNDNLVNTIGMARKNINDNKIINDNNQVSYIVHQYDRCDNTMLNKISLKYNFVIKR